MTRFMVGRAYWGTDGKKWVVTKRDRKQVRLVSTGYRYEREGAADVRVTHGREMVELSDRIRIYAQTVIE